MRIQLSDFELPGSPGVPGDVVYTAIAYDPSSGRPADDDAPIVHTYFVCGWREDDGAGVLIHGTRHGNPGRHDWRFPRLIEAPSDPEFGVTPIKTKFYGVEPVVQNILRLVGSVESQEKPEIEQGFLYEGPYDGSGSWYFISAPESESTVVKGSCCDILVCDTNDNTDSVHVCSLETQEWVKLHTGYCDPWVVDEIIPAGESFYVIRLLHSDGQRSDLTYKKT